MRTLTQRISEKLLVNKNYKSPYYDFSNVMELYLIRFNTAKPENCIQIDIVDINKIKMKDDDTCTVSGELILSNAHYLNCEFEYDSKNGILYRIDNMFRMHYDILLHQSLKDNFKKFVQEVFNDPERTYFADEVFNILNIEYQELDDKFNAEYDYIENVDNPIYMEKLARRLNIK